MNVSGRIGLAALVLLLAGCGQMKAYEAPDDKAPQALLKLKFKYSEVVPGTTLGARMGIRHDAQDEDDRYQSAFNQNGGISVKLICELHS